MKKLKKLASLFAAALLLAVLPHSNTLTVSAENPTTFCVFFDSDDNEWYYQRDTSTHNIAIEQKEAFQLRDVIHDGDIVVVEGRGNQADGLDLDISNVHLSNLTLKKAATVIIRTGGIDTCYVLNNSVAAINGDVTNAYVYDRASVTFNNNVSNINITYDSDGLYATVTSGGTVDHLIAARDSYTYYECFNIAKGKLEITDGSLQTGEAYYSKTAPESAAQSQPTPQPAQSKPAQTTPSTNTSKPSSDEYDDVPKTGESITAYVWLLGIAALCFAGKLVLKKTSR